MVAFNKIRAFIEAVHHGKHNLETDQLKLALTNTAPDVADEVLADLTQVSYTNLSSRDLTTSSSGQTAGVYKLVIADLTLTATGGAVATFRYVYVYNDDATDDDLIGYYDYGVGGVTLAEDQELDIDFDGTNGLFDSE